VGRGEGGFVGLLRDLYLLQYLEGTENEHSMSEKEKSSSCVCFRYALETCLCLECQDKNRRGKSDRRLITLCFLLHLLSATLFLL
jgi:hypothetical protein